MRLLNSFLSFAGLALFLTSSLLTASPVACPEAPISYYTDNFSNPVPIPANQCTVGSLIYKQFYFLELFTDADPVPVDSNFLMSPDTGTGGFAITIPQGFYAEKYYYLGYTVDPAPILGGEELSLDDFSSFAAQQFDGFAFFSFQSSPEVLVSKWACAQGLLGAPPDVSVPIVQGSVSCSSEQSGQPIFLQVGPGESRNGDFNHAVFFTQVGILFYLNGDLPDITARTAPRLIELEPVPEPSSALLLGGGILGLLALRRRKK